MKQPTMFQDRPNPLVVTLRNRLKDLKNKISTNKDNDRYIARAHEIELILDLIEGNGKGYKELGIK